MIVIALVSQGEGRCRDGDIYNEFDNGDKNF